MSTWEDLEKMEEEDTMHMIRRREELQIAQGSHH